MYQIKHKEMCFIWYFLTFQAIIRVIRVIRVQNKENHPFGWFPIVGGPTACTGTSGALPDVMFSGAYPPVSLSL